LKGLIGFLFFFSSKIKYISIICYQQYNNTSLISNNVSEIRLIEALENVCKSANIEPKTICEEILEDHEHIIENWYFSDDDGIGSLHNALCESFLNGILSFLSSFF